MRHDVCKGGSTSGRTGADIPKVPSRAPNHLKKLDFHGPPENGTAKFWGCKSCGINACCSLEMSSSHKRGRVLPLLFEDASTQGKGGEVSFGTFSRSWKSFNMQMYPS